MPALAGYENISLNNPLDYQIFVATMAPSKIMLTESGGIQHEAPSLDKPVLVLRDTTERPEGVAAVTERLVGADAARIVTETSSVQDDTDACSQYGQSQYRLRINRA